MIIRHLKILKKSFKNLEKNLDKNFDFDFLSIRFKKESSKIKSRLKAGKRGKKMDLQQKMAEIAKKAISAEPAAKKSGFKTGYVPEKISSYEEMTEISRQYREILSDAKGKIFPIAQRVGVSARFDCFCYDFSVGEFMPNSLPLGQADTSLPYLTFRLDAGDYIQSPEISALGQEIFPDFQDFLMVDRKSVV